MADFQQPSPGKRKLPFKRTVRHKSSEVADNDGLSLFSRSGEFFEEQQRLAREKAEKAEKEKAAQFAREEQEREDRLARERQAKEDALNPRLSHRHESAKKRRRITLSDDEKEDHIIGTDDNDDEDVFGYKPLKKQESPSLPRTPTSKRGSSFITSRRDSGHYMTRSRSRNTGTPIISLDNNDDDDDEPTMLDSPSKKPLGLKSRLKSSIEILKKDLVTLVEDSDPQLDTGEGQKKDEEEDPSEYYIRAARERMRKAEEERKARENGGSNTTAVDDDPIVSILIRSHVRGTFTLIFRRKISQKLTVVYQTWIEQQVAKHSIMPRSILETVFFTWKGNKVYPHTTLQTLGIRPERDGSLYPGWKEKQEGYEGRDKVYFEAWTQDLYDEFLEDKEKQRLRDLGELVEEEEAEEKKEQDHPQDSQEDQKIRVHFKAKNRPATKATVRSSTTAAQLVKVYRRLADIPEGKTVELRWDGEVLEPETTVEEADIEDMDSLEVHIK